KKNAELAVTGPYAYTRNPLYLGSMMIAFGFAAASRSWWVAGLLVGLFAVIYVPVIRGEEEFLRGAFPEFAEYARRVPRLLPRLTRAGGLGGEFSSELYWRHREYQALLGAVGMYAALAVRMLWRR
ncbi:MAG TPA: isoprenylcysteine carboxylmethyltransferase family protein, partial [Acidisarcina sp.]